MKIYVAAKWEERPHAREVMRRLKENGHQISFDWTIGQLGNGKQADEDMNGVLNADCIILLAEKKLNYRGALVELGAAIATGKRVILVGSGVDNCIFSMHPVIERVWTAEEAIDLLGVGEEEIPF